MNAELEARRTAAAAVADDFQAAMAAFARGGQRPDYVAWALRLDQHLRYVLSAPVDDQAAAQLAEIRAVVDAFDWEGDDDLQFALEKVDGIVNRRRS